MPRGLLTTRRAGDWVKIGDITIYIERAGSRRIVLRIVAPPSVRVVTGPGPDAPPVREQEAPDVPEPKA